MEWNESSLPSEADIGTGWDLDDNSIHNCSHNCTAVVDLKMEYLMKKMKKIDDDLLILGED